MDIPDKLERPRTKGSRIAVTDRLSGVSIPTIFPNRTTPPLGTHVGGREAGLHIEGRGNEVDSSIERRAVAEELVIVFDQSMQERVLESSHFPEITFTSEQIQPAGDNAWRVSGKLQLHGQSGLIHLSVRKLDGRYVGATTIKQTDYGLQPIRAVGGAVRVKNELKIDFVIETR
jgi:YceI-like domain